MASLRECETRNGAIMRPTQFSADAIIDLLRNQTIASLAEGQRRARHRRQQAHRVPQAQGPRRPYQLLASRRLLHPRPTRRLRRARPVVLRRRPLLPRRHPGRNRRVVRQPRRCRSLRRRVGQPARGRHPGRAAQARRPRAAGSAQARRPVPLLCSRTRAANAPDARQTPAAGHARTRTTPCPTPT